MQYIKDFNENAYQYLANIAPVQWTRSHFTPKALTNCLVNNLSESFNSIEVQGQAYLGNVGVDQGQTYDQALHKKGRDIEVCWKVVSKHTRQVGEIEG